MKNSKKIKTTNDFVTKGYLDKTIDQQTKKIMIYIDSQLEEVREFKKEFTSFKDSALKTLDWLVGAFKRLDEERLVGSKHYDDMNKKVDSHESRILVLEKKRVYSS